MSSAACKVILCGDPPRAAIDDVVKFADAVMAGDITLTPAIEQKMLELASEFDMACAVIRSGFGKLMQEAFP